MWEISLPHWWDFVIRAVVIYVFLLVLLRMTGKRQTGDLSPFDLVLLLILSNAVQNSMNGGDNSITGGIILATTLVLLNSLVGWLTYSNRSLEALIEGRPIILIHNGKIDHDALRRTNLSLHELQESLRANGCVGPSQVRFAVVENTGKISVIRMHEDELKPPAEGSPNHNESTDRHTTDNAEN